MHTFYAHSVEGKPVGDWHRLEEHEGTVPDLRTERSGVVESGLSPAKRSAAQFAAEFGCGEWGRIAGLWHEKLKVSLFLPCLNETMYLRYSKKRHSAAPVAE